ncbi:hypothetical protein WSM22_38640 [Cytophagales bacterium WSM2-2]|nr:hypothetical protein WSM22_38640 [Cytophagales bacterium WSM2-2]
MKLSILAVLTLTIHVNEALGQRIVFSDLVSWIDSKDYPLKVFEILEGKGFRYYTEIVKDENDLKYNKYYINIWRKKYMLRSILVKLS